MFWSRTTRSLTSLDWLWLKDFCASHNSRILVAANVKYLDLAEPAYVDDKQRAKDKFATLVCASTIARARHNWTFNWYAAIFLGKTCQVNCIAFSCFQAFHLQKRSGSQWISDKWYHINFDPVVSEICDAKNFIHDCRMLLLEPALSANFDPRNMLVTRMITMFDA